MWKPPLHGLLLTAIVCCDLLSSRSTAAQSPLPEKTAWRTGAELDHHLPSAISVSWADVPLSNLLRDFSQQQKIAIFLDRRIDPGTPINFSRTDATIEQALWSIAAKHDWGVCRLDNVYYFGPSETAAVLPLLWQQLGVETGRLKRNSPVAWQRASDFNLPFLSNPADELQKLAAENHFEIIGETLPHDRWPAISLPRLSLDQRVALLTIGFGQWFERTNDGKQIKLVALPNIENGKIDFGAQENFGSLLTELRKQNPACRITANRKSFVVSGTPHDIAAIGTQLVMAQKPRRASHSDPRQFTLTTRAARGSILATIAQQTGRQLKFDPALSNPLNEHIDLSVKEVSLEQLLNQTLDGSGLRYELDKETLTIMK